MANLVAACRLGGRRAVSIVSRLEAVEGCMQRGDWHGAGLSVGEALGEGRLLVDLLARMQDVLAKEEMKHGYVESGGG